MNREELLNEMIRRLAMSARNRYHSALAEGKTDVEAFEEIIRTIFEVYADRLSE